MKNVFNNKWFRAAIPALLIHCSIGTVYCWSLIKQDIADYIGHPVVSVEWAFSIAIFCLGMSAAFGGNVVEKDIHKSSLIAAICFTTGMIGTGICIYFKSLIGIYLFYGVVMGIGLGFGYLSPVKTLMLWFSEQKGLATGLAVAGFGLAKVIASPIMNTLLIHPNIGVIKMFYILAALYFVMMFTGHLLLKKPEGWVEEPHAKSDAKASTIFRNKTFIGIWLMFFINITCGLALISQEKGIMHTIGMSDATIAIMASVTAIFNAAGRLGFSSAADKLKDRNTIYKVIFILCIGLTVATFLTNGIEKAIIPLVLSLLFMVNAGYGGGFSNLPTLLSDRFGMKTISAVHGLALSAWAIAGIAGNQLSSFILTKTNSFTSVLYVIAALFTVALIISFVLVKPGKME